MKLWNPGDKEKDLEHPMRKKSSYMKLIRNHNVCNFSKLTKTEIKWNSGFKFHKMTSHVDFYI